MKKFSIQDLMQKLSGIPGLRFLDVWLTEFRATRTGVDQRVGDFQAYYDRGREGVSDVAGAVSSDSDEDGDLDDMEDGDSVPRSARDDDADDYY